MRVPAATAIVLGVLASAGAASAIVGPPQPPQRPPTAPSATGLFGYVSRGPLSPRCVPPRPCFRPARVTLRFGRTGARVLLGRATTQASGAYRVALRPGVYSVTVAPGLGRVKPSLVVVPAGGWKRVVFILDTGIY